MESKKLIEGLVGGVLFGFTAGIGFILATRIMTKKIVQTETTENRSMQAPTITVDDDMDDSSNWSSFEDGANFEINDFIEGNKVNNPNTRNSVHDSWTMGGGSNNIGSRKFDFSTGTYVNI